MNLYYLTTYFVQDYKEKLAYLIILVAFMFQLFFPQAAYAREITVENTPIFRAFTVEDAGVDLLTKRFEDFKNLPVNKVEIYKVVSTRWVTSTAYSSEPAQTDDTPCLTANMYDVCKANVENVVAANFLKFNTKIRVPELYGDQIFVVKDRMHPRFSDRVDFWKTSKERAIQHGVKYIKIEVLK